MNILWNVFVRPINSQKEIRIYIICTKHVKLYIKRDVLNFHLKIYFTKECENAIAYLCHMRDKMCVELAIGARETFARTLDFSEMKLFKRRRIYTKKIAQRQRIYTRGTYCSIWGDLAVKINHERHTFCKT